MITCRLESSAAMMNVRDFGTAATRFGIDVVRLGEAARALKLTDE
jgi:hypothetical protein